MHWQKLKLIRSSFCEQWDMLLNNQKYTYSKMHIRRPNLCNKILSRIFSEAEHNTRHVIQFFTNKFNRNTLPIWDGVQCSWTATLETAICRRMACESRQCSGTSDRTGTCNEYRITPAMSLWRQFKNRASKRFFCNKTVVILFERMSITTIYTHIPRTS